MEVLDKAMVMLSPSTSNADECQHVNDSHTIAYVRNTDPLIFTPDTSIRYAFLMVIARSQSSKVKSRMAIVGLSSNETPKTSVTCTISTFKSYHL